MFLLTLVLLLAGAGTGDWSRFRGPNGTGIQETGRLPAELGATRNVVWKAALPPGYSSPVVSGEWIFVTAFEGEKLLTIALDRASGKERWRRESPRDRREKLDPRNGPASPTPVADGRNVYVFFPDYGLLSYTFAGEERWRTPLGPFNNVYGMGSSPVLAGDLLILVCDQNRGSFAAGFRQSDGREFWRSARPDALSGHSTPIVYDPPGGPLQVVAPGSFRMDNYSVATGEIVSWVNGLPGEMKSGPVLVGDIIYVNGFSTPDNDPGQQVIVPPSPRSWRSTTRTRTARSPRPRRPTSGRAATLPSSISTRTARPMRPNGGSGSTALPPRMACWPFAPEAAAIGRGRACSGAIRVRCPSCRRPSSTAAACT